MLTKDNIKRTGISEHNLDLAADIMNFFDLWRLYSTTEQGMDILDEIVDEVDQPLFNIFTIMTNEFGKLSSRSLGLDHYMTTLNADNRKILHQTSRYIVKRIKDNIYSSINIQFSLTGVRPNKATTTIHMPGFLLDTEFITPGKSGIIPMIGMLLDVDITIKSYSKTPEGFDKYDGVYSLRLVE